MILLEDCGGEAGAVRVAERVLQAFERPFTLGEETLALRVSVGIAVTEAHDESADDLLAHADVAMYRAKQTGGDGLAVFDSTLRARANERVSLARDLRAAIGTDQLSLHYQPIVDLASQRVTSVEALVRWQHPVRGQVAPDEFVRLAEDTGVIVELGRWVLERACTEFAAALDEAGRQADRAGREPVTAPAGGPRPARPAARASWPAPGSAAAAWRWRSPRPP